MKMTRILLCAVITLAALIVPVLYPAAHLGCLVVGGSCVLWVMVQCVHADLLLLSTKQERDRYYDLTQQHYASICRLEGENRQLVVERDRAINNPRKPTQGETLQAAMQHAVDHPRDMTTMLTHVDDKGIGIQEVGRAGGEPDIVITDEQMRVMTAEEAYGPNKAQVLQSQDGTIATPVRRTTMSEGETTALIAEGKARKAANEKEVDELIETGIDEFLANDPTYVERSGQTEAACRDDLRKEIG